MPAGRKLTIARVLCTPPRSRALPVSAGEDALQFLSLLFPRNRLRPGGCCGVQMHPGGGTSGTESYGAPLLSVPGAPLRSSARTEVALALRGARLSPPCSAPGLCKGPLAGSRFPASARIGEPGPPFYRQFLRLPSSSLLAPGATPRRRPLCSAAGPCEGGGRGRPLLWLGATHSYPLVNLGAEDAGGAL